MSDEPPETATEAVYRMREDRRLEQCRAIGRVKTRLRELLRLFPDASALVCNTDDIAALVEDHDKLIMDALRWMAAASPGSTGTSPSEGRKPDPCQESTQAHGVDPTRS